MNNCMHIIDVKETGTKIVTYCTLCGTIFNVKEAQEYNIRDSYLSSGTYTGNPYPPKLDGTHKSISSVDLASSPYMVKDTKEVKQ